MRMLIQCVANANVVVDGAVIGEIGKGFLVFLGVSNDDTNEIAEKMVKKLLGLRVFKDENGKTNLALKDVGGKILVISQFTLYADCRRGNRPGFERKVRLSVFVFEHSQAQKFFHHFFSNFVCIIV